MKTSFARVALTRLALTLATCIAALASGTAHADAALAKGQAPG